MLLVSAALVLTALVNVAMVLIVTKMSTAYKRAVTPFVYSAFMVILWTIGTALIITHPSGFLYYLGIYLFLIAPLWVMLYLFVFMSRFPNENGARRGEFRFVLAITVAATLYSLILNDSIIWLQSGNEGSEIVVSRMLYGLYALVFVIYSLLISIVLTRKLKLNPTGIKRAQIGFIYAGASISSALAFFTNLLLPILGTTEYIWLGPVFTLLYAMGYGFAIKRYRLFDMRLFASRAVAYVGALGALLGIYSLAASWLKSMLHSSLNIPFDSDIYYAFIMLLGIVLYPSVKLFFDEITRKIFFHQDYDVQDVMDRLGDLLLRARSRRDIQRNFGKLFSDFLFVSKVSVIYRQDETQAKRVLEKIEITRADPVVELSEISLDDESDHWMRKNGIAVIAPIETHSHKIGWLLFSDKRNGDPYTIKDKRVISIAADEIAIGLENALQYEQIDAFNDVLKQNIKEATSKLRFTNKKLRDLDATKDEFISMASHQLRTPLTSVKGYLSMVLEGDAGEINAQQRKLLEEAFTSSQRMVYLIGDFLNVSRIQTGKFELERSDVSLPSIISEEISQLKATAKSRGIELAYHAPVDFPVMHIDENKIRQVMMNFIDNAIYYSPEDTKINISLAKYDNRIEFKVVDQGIGVPKDAQHHLFTKFFRADNAKQQRPDGTGIGLFMAKKVIVEHNGAIMFESTENKGSMFGFRLPLEQSKTPLQ